MISAVDTLGYSLEMDWTLIWATAKLLGRPTSWFRITLGAGIAVLPTLWVLLQQSLYAVPWELGLVWPVLVMIIAFPGVSRQLWLKSCMLFVAISFLAGGLLSAGLTWFHTWDPAFPRFDWVLMVPLLLAVLAYGVPKYRVRQLVGRESFGEVRLELNGKTLTVPVLWDSGNQLSDPISHRPVVIIEMASAFPWLPDSLFSWAVAVQRSGTGVVPPEWQGRAGLVPFRTLTGEGWLPVVALDQGMGNFADVWYSMVPVMVGLSKEKISSDGSYVALATPKSLIRFPNERVGA